MDIKILKKVQFFDTLTDEELKEVMSASQKEDFKKDEKIFSEGDKGDKLYVILSGEIRISKNIPGIGEEALSVLHPGSYFGEMALIEDVPRSADAIIHEDASLMSVSKGDLEKLMEKNVEVGNKILWKFVGTLSHRLRETNDKIRSFFAMTGGF